MDLLIIVSIILMSCATALIAYPLWQQMQPQPARSQAPPPGRTLAETEARYQAIIATIKELMFDYEMGKLAAKDYNLQLSQAKLEAARLKKRIDWLQSGRESGLSPQADAQIEAMIAHTRHAAPPSPAIRRQVEKTISRIKQGQAVVPTCSHCERPAPPGDRWCAGCGQLLPAFTANSAAAQTVRCSHCSGSIKPGDAFCAHCGVALTPPPLISPATQTPLL